MRLALGLEYDGTSFHGWQKQPKGVDNTVQASLEEALGKVADHPVSTVVAGRTDVGVHACEQVVHFDTTAERKESAWVLGSNSLLPDSVRVLWTRRVSDDFHARFSAQARRYCYVLSTNEGPMSLWRDRCHRSESLCVESMRAGAAHLWGSHDMSSFRGSQCQAKSPLRHIYFLRIHCRHTWVLVDIQANGFLQHMVRNIVGSLLEVGAKRQAPEWMAQLLACKDRNQAAPTAPSCGLYLTRVRYPVHCELPSARRPCPVAMITDVVNGAAGANRRYCLG